jgi:hypothetical protein
MFNDNFLRQLARSRVEDSLRSRPRTTRQRRIDVAPVTIRHAASADLPSLERLAALDSQRIPSGELFVAEVGGRLLAATSIDTGAVIADPFEPTAGLVDLLRVQAAAARPAAALPVVVDERVDQLLPEAA